MATKSKDLDKPPDENNNLQRLSQSLGMSLEDVKTMMSSAGGALPGAADATMKTSAFSGTPPISVTDDIISNRGRKRSSLTKPGGKSPLWTHFTRGAKMPGNNNYYRAYCNYCRPNAKGGDKFMEGRVRNLENHLKYCASYHEAVRRNCALAMDGYGNNGETPIIYIKTLSDKATVPTRPSPLSAGYQLFSAESVHIPAGERAVVKTNLSISIPPGTYGRVTALSNLAFESNSIDIGPGVVDADYRDDVRVKVINYSSTDFQVSVGDKIAQLILEKICVAEIEVVNNLSKGEIASGTSGFSSEKVLSADYSLKESVDIPNVTKDENKRLKVESDGI